MMSRRAVSVHEVGYVGRLSLLVGEVCGHVGSIGAFPTCCFTCLAAITWIEEELSSIAVG